jgi:hypothetical protein
MDGHVVAIFEAMRIIAPRFVYQIVRYAKRKKDKQTHHALYRHRIMENNNQQFLPAEGMYQGPTLDRDVATFVDKNLDYYAYQWAKRNKRGKVRHSWNGAAFLFGPIWLVYRKMYWQTAAYMIAAAIVGIVAGLESNFNYVVPLALSVIANRLYGAQVDKKVATLRTGFAASGDLREHLASRGGTNRKGAWIATIIFTVAICGYVWWTFPANSSC